MSKTNNEEIAQQWRDVSYILGYTFGPDKVSNDARVLRIKGDSSHPVQRELLAKLIGIIGSSFLDDLTFSDTADPSKMWVPGDDASITLRISKDQNPEALLDSLKLAFGNQQSSPDGKIVSLRPGHDEAYKSATEFINDLEKLSGVAWKEEIGGKYGVRVLKPILTYQPSESQRTEQEMIIAEASIASHHSAKVKSWLVQQRETEDRTDQTPETAMAIQGLLNPDDKSVKSKLNGSTNNSWLKREAQKAFADPSDKSR